jgi:hypothetical protein
VAQELWYFRYFSVMYIRYYSGIHFSHSATLLSYTSLSKRSMHGIFVLGTTSDSIDVAAAACLRRQRMHFVRTHKPRSTTATDSAPSAFPPFPYTFPHTTHTPHTNTYTHTHRPTQTRSEQPSTVRRQNRSPVHPIILILHPTLNTHTHTHTHTEPLDSSVS